MNIQLFKQTWMTAQGYYNEWVVRVNGISQGAYPSQKEALLSLQKRGRNGERD